MSKPVDPRVLRPLLVGFTAVMCGVLSLLFWSHPQVTGSDLGQVWAGARALLHGRDPYLEVGPGRNFEWQFPLLYPLTAVLAAVPLAWLPLRAADALFVAGSAGLLAWGLTRRIIANPQLLVFVSLPYLYAIQTSQWSPAITAAALVPAAGFLLACKPTIAMGLIAAFPTRRAFLSAGALTLLSLVIRPSWPQEWMALLPAARHVHAPITAPGGFLILLAALKWRRPEARLLAVLAVVPQTLSLYEVVPLFLVVSTWREAWGLWALAIAAYIAQQVHPAYPSYDAYIAAGAHWIVWLVYLPSTLLVLTRSNIVPADDHRNSSSD